MKHQWNIDENNQNKQVLARVDPTGTTMMIVLFGFVSFCLITSDSFLFVLCVLVFMLCFRASVLVGSYGMALWSKLKKENKPLLLLSL